MRSGELRPASWTEAFAVAARGLAEAGATGVLPGGRLTAEDAFAYSTFARVALGTNDIDFRSRPHSEEEAAFLAAEVSCLRARARRTPTSRRPTPSILVGLEPEDEAGTIFLRLRKAHRKHRTRIWSVAPFTTNGLRKMGGTLIPTAPGGETEAVAGVGARHRASSSTPPGVILVGERMATVPGALTAVASSGAHHRRQAGLGAASCRRPRRGRDRLPARPAARRPSRHRRRRSRRRRHRVGHRGPARAARA